MSLRPSCAPLGRRVSKTVDNDADWDCTYHDYYDTSWRRIERTGGSDQVLKQYVYGIRYVDNPVQIGVNQAPTHDPDFDPQDEDHDPAWYYPIQDANFNVTALFDSDGTLEERYAYTPYGDRAVYHPDDSGTDDYATVRVAHTTLVQVSGEDQPYGLCDLGHQGLFHTYPSHVPLRGHRCPPGRGRSRKHRTGPRRSAQG